MLFVSSTAPLDVESQVGRSPRAPTRSRATGVRVPEDVAAALALDEEGSRRLRRGRTLATDDRNLFATDSPRVLGHPISSLDRLLSPYDPLPARLAGLDAVYLCRRLVQMQRYSRAERLAKSLKDPLERMLAQAEVAFGRNEPRKAADFSARALALDPRSEWARYRSSSDGAAPAHAGRGDVIPLLEEGRRLRTARSWVALERLDGPLGRIDLRHPAHPDAQQLRIDWRLGRGSVAGSAEALRLIDLEPFGGVEQLARRALAGVQSTEAGVASRSLALLAVQLGKRSRALSPLAAEWAIAALDGTPLDELPETTQALRPRLVRLRDQAPRS